MYSVDILKHTGVETCAIVGIIIFAANNSSRNIFITLKKLIIGELYHYKPHPLAFSVIR